MAIGIHRARTRRRIESEDRAGTRRQFYVVRGTQALGETIAGAIPHKVNSYFEAWPEAGRFESELGELTCAPSSTPTLIR